MGSAPVKPATQCGEAYFEEAEVESIQSLIQAVDERADKLIKTA